MSLLLRHIRTLLNVFSLFRSSSCSFQADPIELCAFGTILQMHTIPTSSYLFICRDVSSIQPGTPLKLLGIISAHTRPVQCLSADAHSEHTATLFTADSMGLIKVWALERTYGEIPSCRASLKEEWSYHRTGISDIWYGQGQLWTGRWSAARSSRKRGKEPDRVSFG